MLNDAWTRIIDRVLGLQMLEYRLGDGDRALDLCLLPQPPASFATTECWLKRNASMLMANVALTALRGSPKVLKTRWIESAVASKRNGEADAWWDQAAWPDFRRATKARESLMALSFGTISRRQNFSFEDARDTRRC